MPSISTGIYVPTFQIAVYAVDQGMDPDIAFYTYVGVLNYEAVLFQSDFLHFSVSVLNAASTFGRLVPNFFGNKLGELDLMHYARSA